MNAVKDRKVCSLARREAEMDSRIVEDMKEKLSHRPSVSTCSLSSSERPKFNSHSYHGIPGPARHLIDMPTSSVSPAQIPITVFTGFLGAGKTSIILSLLPQLPSDYRVVLLKNEFGDIEGSYPRRVSPVFGVPISAADYLYSSRQSTSEAEQSDGR